MIGRLESKAGKSRGKQPHVVHTCVGKAFAVRPESSLSFLSLSPPGVCSELGLSENLISLPSAIVFFSAPSSDSFVFLLIKPIMSWV